MRSLPAKWREVGFYDAFERLKLKSFEIPTKDYLSSGQHPIVDQGDGAIAGYIDRDGPISTVPFIVFGDHTTIVKYVETPCFIGSQGVVPLRAKDCYDPYFLYLMLGRTRIPALGYSRHFRELENKTFPLPPLAEQRKIAEILRTWDESIETAEAELKAKQERKRGMMQRLLSPGRQIKRKLGNSFNQSVRRFELTNGWAWMFIHEVAKLSFSSVDKKSVEGEKSVRLCNYMDVFYNRRIREGMPFMDSTASDSDIKKFTLNEGDVVLTKDSETPEEIAFAAVIDGKIDNLVCGYHLAVLRPDKAKVTGEYLMSAINFHPNHHQFVRLANGATRFGLGIDSLNNAVIPVPPLEEQRKISEILQNADAGIEVINNRIEALRAQKRGLMQKLLTGEVRVAA